MLYIGLIKTKSNSVYREFGTFEETWAWLNNTNEPNTIEALVLEETHYLDDQFPDFDSCRVIASVRSVQ